MWIDPYNLYREHINTAYFIFEQFDDVEGMLSCCVDETFGKRSCSDSQTKTIEAVKKKVHILIQEIRSKRTVPSDKAIIEIVVRLEKLRNQAKDKYMLVQELNDKFITAKSLLWGQITGDKARYPFDAEMK